MSHCSKTTPLDATYIRFSDSFFGIFKLRFSIPVFQLSFFILLDVV